MLYVSIFVELLRSRPSLAVWLAALAQGLLWLLVPSLFYAGPPGDLPSVLAVGHEFQLGTYLGPPLAFWLAELAYDLAGRSLVGVYLLSHSIHNDNNRLPSALEFGSHLGAGVRLDPRLSVGFAVQHISNAGIKQPNGGINLYLLTASYRL